MVGNKQIGKTICVACKDPIVDHSKRQLWRCLYRIQGTVVYSKLMEPKS